MSTETAAPLPAPVASHRMAAVLFIIPLALLLCLALPAARHTLAFLLPWEWSPTLMVCMAGTALLYTRGLWRARLDRMRIGFWKPFAFYLGLGLMYFVMQTRYDYYAQHMFFMHRAQHLILHHLGPFLMALAVPLDMLRAGTPDVIHRRVILPLLQHRLTQHVMNVLQNAIISPLLFVGIIYFWLEPGLHFDAMINGSLYKVMNVSMALDGLLFWFLMLDPRPRPLARLGYGSRIIALCAVMPPQIVLGAHIGLSRVDLYPIYQLCGRAFDLTAVADQQIGGLITWIPACMMSVIGALVVLRMLLKHDSSNSESIKAPRAD